MGNYDDDLWPVQGVLHFYSRLVFNQSVDKIVTIIISFLLPLYVCVQKVIRMKSKENLKREIYELLDWIETAQSENILLFWKCVFKDIILNQYPTLKMLYNSLMDGKDIHSFFCVCVSDCVFIWFYSTVLTLPLK